MALNYRQQIIDGVLIPLGYTQMTSGTVSTATGLQSIPTGALYAWIITENQAIRWRDDSVSPTTSSGMPIDAGKSFIYAAVGTSTAGVDLSSVGFKLIEQAAGAVVNISYYR